MEALLQRMSLSDMKAQMESTSAAALPALGVSAFKWQARLAHQGRGEEQLLFGRQVGYPSVVTKLPALRS